MIIKEELNRIGDMLNQFYNLELMVNNLLVAFFKPEKKVEFTTLLLNTSITSYGAKVKLMANIIAINPKIVTQLHELGRIRNGIAHVSPHLEVNPKDGSLFTTSKIHIMNSSGKIVAQDFWEWSKTFNELLDSVVPVILKQTRHLEEG